MLFIHEAFPYQSTKMDRQAVIWTFEFKEESPGAGFVFMIHLSRAQFREGEHERKKSVLPTTTDNDLIIYFNLTAWGQAEFSMTQVLFEELKVTSDSMVRPARLLCSHCMGSIELPFPRAPFKPWSPPTTPFESRGSLLFYFKMYIYINTNLCGDGGS